MRRAFSMHFSRLEIQDLFKAWVAISLAFTFIHTGLSFNSSFFLMLAVSAFSVGTAFLLHELAHKYSAQRFGCWAEFRSFDQMLIFAILMSFFGFVFAAPGAVFIQGHISKRQNGIISSAGIATNLVLAVLFRFISFFNLPYFIALLAVQAAFINAWLALFNLLPFFGLDGGKVLQWNPVIYFTMGAAALVLLIV